MIKEELLKKEYYIDKLSMFMKESYGILPQIEIFVEWLTSINTTSEDIANLLDIWDVNTDKAEDYMTMVNRLCPNGEDFLPLDVIGTIVGCSRENIIFVPNENNTDSKTKEIVKLNNEELLELIKCKIVQNNYDGSLQSLIDLYKNKLGYIVYYSLNLSFEQYSPYEPATCSVYFEDEKADGTPVSDNIKKIFKYSDFFIQSLGIVYNRGIISDIDHILVLDKEYDQIGEYTRIAVSATNYEELIPYIYTKVNETYVKVPEGSEYIEGQIYYIQEQYALYPPSSSIDISPYSIILG